MNKTGKRAKKISKSGGNVKQEQILREDQAARGREGTRLEIS